MGSGKTTSFYVYLQCQRLAWDSRTRKDWNGAVWVNKYYYTNTFDANGLRLTNKKKTGSTTNGRPANCTNTTTMQIKTWLIVT